MKKIIAVVVVMAIVALGSVGAAWANGGQPCEDGPA